MHPIKLVWATRAVIYKLFFKKFGHKCYMGKPCFIGGGKHILIGNKVRIFPGIRMEAIGSGCITIRDNCAIEQGVHITSKDENLIIEKDCTILAYTFITNVNHNYDMIDRSVLEQGHTIKTTHIGEGCFIGYGASIQAGTILGKHCVVGTGAVVNGGTYPDYSVLVGVPARIVKKYNHKTKLWEKV
jgi:acetyltransferase-like isoleucine patch superfamily enzyme